MNLLIPINKHKVWRQGGKNVAVSKQQKELELLEEQWDPWAQLVTHRETHSACVRYQLAYS